MQKKSVALSAIILFFMFVPKVFSQSSDPSDTLKVIVRILPAKPVLNINRDSIYVGQSVTLTASNCNGKITWSGGATTNTLTVSPTKTQYFTAFCTSNFGCIGAQDSIKVNVSTLQNPTASPQTICDGESTTLTASGCIGGTIKWNNGLTGRSISVSPAYESGSTTTAPVFSETTFSYTCTYPNNGQSQEAKVAVKVNFKPQVPTITANPAKIITNGSSTLSVSNCVGTVEWQKDNAGVWANDGIGATKTITLTKSTTYRARCTSAQGCSSAYSNGNTVIVSSPVPNVTASAQEVCQGTNVVLTASGCSGTYKWSTGSVSPSITVSSQTNGFFEVVCQDSAGASTSKKVRLSLQ